MKPKFQPLFQSVKKGKGLRIDGTILHPASGESVWYDTTSVHSTCKRLSAGKEAAKLQSAVLYQAHKAKLDRYALLGAIVERQTLDGLRSLSPMILPVAVSSHGEFCVVHVAWENG